MGQLAVGAVLGAIVALLLEHVTSGDLMGGHAIVILPIVLAFMAAVGLIATAGPARRMLRISPTEALRGN